jgi:NAD(P)H dehydrogenase (quinone)
MPWDGVEQEPVGVAARNGPHVHLGLLAERGRAGDIRAVVQPSQGAVQPLRHDLAYRLGVCIQDGVPYSTRELLELGEVSGGTPYGVSTIAGPEASGSRR